MNTNDLAAVVRDAAKKRLDDGELKPNLRDGLAAQALLDRRDEKQKDRNFMLSLARLTSGAGSPPPEHVIEGSFVPIEALTSGQEQGEEGEGQEPALTGIEEDQAISA